MEELDKLNTSTIFRRYMSEEDITIDISGSNSSYYSKNEIDDKLNDIRNNLENYVTKDDFDNLLDIQSSNATSITNLGNNLNSIMSKIKNTSIHSCYVVSPTLTINDGDYIILLAKTQYLQSSIWVVDNNGVMALVNNCSETLEKTKNEDGTITLKWSKANYSKVLLIKLRSDDNIVVK